ncbi:MAG: DMT family transporter, partial [Deltaproteobacteria bacterium]|nr:DMT family transporter [Deltaproteobacteria bacterium]
SLTFGAFLISFSGVWVKVAHVAPNVSAFYRVFIAGVALLAAALYRRELRWPGIRHLLLSLVCGLLLALDLWLYHYSIQYIGPGLGTILPNFQVFILAAVGILVLKESVRWIYLISLPLAFVGLFMIVGLNWSQLQPTYRIGVIYGLAAAVCYAGFLLSLRQLQAAQMGTSFFYVLMLVSLTTAAFLGADVVLKRGSFQIPDLQTALALAALGLLSHTVGWILITNALPKIRASLSGLILLLQPALAFVWDVLFFQRPTTLVNWLGVMIALIAIYMGMARQSDSGH